MDLLQILIVDDDPLDAEMFECCWEKTDVALNVTVVDDGTKAIQYLHKEKPYDKATRPDLILLDLNMPIKNGRETLVEIKQHDQFKEIPIIVLTSSNLKADIESCQEAGADAYLVKPMGIKEYSKVIKTVQNFLEKKRPLK